MSSTQSGQTISQNGKSASSLEADIALLTRLLSQDLNDPDSADADPASVEELLRRLEAAEGLADGVEERLDGIIGNLDTLLSDLEAAQEKAEGGPNEVAGFAGAAGQSEASERDAAPK
ncbi:hypothetical protein C8Q76DRAFT_856477 [Earliella scabrosa]|nr:hypothetical protein C8Q76DRAFT_856477 [Earliella scabrosa]